MAPKHDPRAAYVFAGFPIRRTFARRPRILRLEVSKPCGATIEQTENGGPVGMSWGL